jgi:glycosyltransferase involved in cell wall biosynthesis
VGVETINEVIVRRFPALVNRTPSYTHPVLKPFGNFPNTPDAEYGWTDEGMHSPQLYNYLLEQGQSFDYLIFIPYPFGFTCYSASIYPERAIIWPCLHDDIVAYFEPVRVMLKQARGIILNSQAEQRFLGRQLQIENSHQRVIGYGLGALRGEAQRFYERHPQLRGPFILYAGRLEKAKNVHLLLDYFVEYVEARQNGINLVLIGSGPVSVPTHPHIFQLGYVSEQDKHDAYAAAMVLCQPSVYESFGITLLEAWLQQTPVLVHRDCQVTLEHCLLAQGGLYFQDNVEFAGALDYFVAYPDAARHMGLNGKNYVETYYNWDQLVKKLMQTLVSWQNVNNGVG